MTLSLLSVLNGQISLMGIAVFLIFLNARILPAFRYQETTGVFLLSLPSVLPWSIRLTAMVSEFIDVDLPGLFRFSFHFIVFFITLSIFEIILCLISRLIWREQDEIMLK